MSGDPRIGDQFDLLRGSIDRTPKTPAHQSHSETSKAAAVRIAPKAEGLRYEVWSVIADAGEAGATRKEIETATGLLTQTVTPRIVELKQAGLIRPLTYFDAEKRSIVTVKREGCEVLVTARSVA